MPKYYFQGAIVTPFIAQVLSKQSPRISISLYGSVAFMASFLSFLLPETKGKGFHFFINIIFVDKN